MSRRDSRIGITTGDPAGIGPEIVAGALASLAPPERARAVVFGDRPVLERYRICAGPGGGPELAGPGVIRDKRFPVGSVDPSAGRSALACLDLALSFFRRGAIRALVTAPVSKEAIMLSGTPFPGQTEYLSVGLGAGPTAMVFLGGRLRLLLLTRHVPLREVPGLVGPDLVIEQVTLARDFLARRLGIGSPRVLVCGLNPHAGEGGFLGLEERAVFSPALEKLRARGIEADGPVPADSALGAYRRGRYDLLVSAYHDQFLPVFKAFYFTSGVNLTVGLPLVRTSPAHGTAFDLAGRGLANPEGMRRAIRFALRWTP